MIIVDTFRSFHSSSAWQERSPLQKALLIFILIFAFFCPISVGAAQGAIAAAVICWLASLGKNWRPLNGHRIYLPLILFATFTLVATAFSYNPSESIWSARNLLMLLIVPLIIQCVRRDEEVKWILVALGSGALATSLWGVYEVIVRQAGGHTGERLNGFLGHYMTAGGVLMFAALLLFSIALYQKMKFTRIVALVASVILMMATALTQSRNAYLGLAAGALTLMLVWRKRLIFLLPFVLSLAVLVSPPMVRERVFNMADFTDVSVMNRFYMMETGMGMVADFPLFGVGLRQVSVLYDRYKPEEDPGNVPHLHNNFLQIAAERGVPAMITWTWLMFALAAGHRRLLRRKGASDWLQTASAGAFSVVIALLVAGLFEYNFGDAEVQMLLLLAISLPFGLSISNDKSKRNPNGANSST